MNKDKGKQKMHEEDYSANADDENFVEWVETRSNAQVLDQQINWKANRNAGVISDQSLLLLQEYDGKSADERAALVEEAPEKYAELFLHLLSFDKEGVSSTDTVQHILAWIDEIVQDEDKISIFLNSVKEPFLPFVNILRTRSSQSSDWFINSRASRILAQLLSASDQVHPNGQFLILWCVGYLRDHKESIGDLLLGLHALQLLFRKPEYRLTFGQDRGINILYDLLKANTTSQQMVYKTLFCMWIVSFEPEVAEKFGEIEGLVEEIVEILRTVTKEKIRRMCLAVLRNLLIVGREGTASGASKENRGKMLKSGIVRVLGYLNNRKWGDEDIEEDLEVLTEELGKDLVKMTSWEVYNKEVRGGDLNWTPVHKSEKFWRENVHRFEENNRELVGILLGLIRSSKSARVRSVALYDIGEFCRFHPKGRKIITDMEGKSDIMLSIGSPEPEVLKQALLCVQKMMVHNWEMLSYS